MTWPSGHLTWQISKKWQVVFPWRLDRFSVCYVKDTFEKNNAGFQSMFSSSSPSPLRPRWKRSTLNLPEISWTRNSFFSTWHMAGRIGNLSSFGSKQQTWDRTCSHSCQVSSLKQSNQTHWNQRMKGMFGRIFTNSWLFGSLNMLSSTFLRIIYDHLSWQIALENRHFFKKALDQNSHSQDISPYIPVKTM